MKILVLTGSAHRSGTTARLTAELIRGAEEAGHEVTRIDAAFQNIHPCIGCDTCHTKKQGCVFADDMQKVNPVLLAADAVVFVSPIYYYAMNAQLKTVIDRFFANDEYLHGGKKAALMVTMADDTEESAQGAVASFRGMTRFLGWEIAGMVIGTDCGDVESLEKHDYLQQAYELGRTL